MLHHIFQKMLLPTILAGTMLTGAAAPAVSLAAQAAAQPDSYHDDWLHVNDNAEIVDKDGNPVWITGCNWFGYNVAARYLTGYGRRICMICCGRSPIMGSTFSEFPCPRSYK